MSDIIVYTCITGAKNFLPEYEKEDGVKYICFTDGSVESKTDQWEIKDLILNIEDDPRRTARYHKLMSHEVLPENKYSIWFAGSMIPRVRILDLIKWFEKDNSNEYAVRPHPGWNCVWKEAETIKNLNRQYFDLSDEEIIRINEALVKYNKQKFPREFGLHETGVLLRKNTKKTKSFNEKWWKEVSDFSVRDQMSFDYIRWKTKNKITDLNRDWFKQVNHRHYA